MGNFRMVSTYKATPHHLTNSTDQIQPVLVIGPTTNEAGKCAQSPNPIQISNTQTKEICKNQCFGKVHKKE
jgi:uncharacterized cupin superfamily protein